jgi:hypothetical protein
MRMCRHPNVLSLYASFVVDSELWIVMPLMNKGACSPPLPSSPHCAVLCCAILIVRSTCAGSVAHIIRTLKEHSRITEGLQVLRCVFRVPCVASS